MNSMNIIPLPTATNEEWLDSLQQRLNVTAELEQAEANLIQRNLELIIERNTANKVVNELTELVKNQKQTLDSGSEINQNLVKENHELLTLTQKQKEVLDCERVVSKGLVKALEEIDPEIEKLRKELAHERQNSIKLKGEVASLTKQVKDYKKLGDPEKLISLNKSLRERVSNLTTSIAEDKKANRNKDREINRLTDDLMEAKRNGGSELCLYRSETGEAVYLHHSPLVIKTPNSTQTYVALKFWSVGGLGRLVTWDGKNVMFASLTANPKLHEPKEDMYQFISGWFKQHVHVNGREQSLLTKKAK